ncbi:MAG: DUF4349 domain-containing protein [Candidatus Atribacteria bacterium]|nr:DUF4349 domain-containing protein [Candidatus Atribacteria bacterium]
MKKRTVFVFVALALMLAACGVKAASTPSMPAPANEHAPVPTQAYAGSSDAGKAPGDVSASGAALQERLVIMNADLTIVIPDPQAKVEAISQMANNLGGFVISMNMYQTYTQNGQTAPEGTISIRVPADKLENTLSQIKADAVEVRNETRSGQDVTAAYVDLQSQLTNLEMAEADLQAIMDEAKNNPNSNTTSKTQDVLEVYNQIISVRGQIEVIKGQMQYYEQASAYSLINVTLVAEETIQPIEIGGWKPEGVARDAIQSLIKFWQGFVNFLINLFLLVLPVLITIFGPIVLVIWGIVALVKRQKRKKAKASKV